MRRQYPFHLIEPKWQQFWDALQTFRAWNPGDSIPPEHPFAKRHGLAGKGSNGSSYHRNSYILDMFPYPSGRGTARRAIRRDTPPLIFSPAIAARSGCNVLHPMGWDAFGLPAEQYAIRTGQHPRKTTEENDGRLQATNQIAGLQLCDWSRNSTPPRLITEFHGMMARRHKHAAHDVIAA